MTITVNDVKLLKSQRLPDEADGGGRATGEAIVDNAHRHCEQFFSKKVEDLCSLKVLKKYLLPVE